MTCAELRSLRKTGYPIYCGGGKAPDVGLTFDDGPTRWTPELVRTQSAIEQLRRLGLHAVPVSDLLRLDPPDVQELPNGSGGCNSTWHS